MRRRFRYDRASRKMVEIGASKKEKAPNGLLYGRIAMLTSPR